MSRITLKGKEAKRQLNIPTPHGPVAEDAFARNVHTYKATVLNRCRDKLAQTERQLKEMAVALGLGDKGLLLLDIEPGVAAALAEFHAIMKRQGQVLDALINLARI